MKKRMSNGIQADFEAIARGLYEMMDEKYRAALAFGMCPAPLMELAEKEFRRKIVLKRAAEDGFSEDTETFKLYLKSVRPEIIKEFNHELALAMLAEAKRRNALIV